MIKVIILLFALVANIESFRLPTNLRPDHYTIEILTNLSDEEGYTFYGREWITVTCYENTNSLVLHSSHLEIYDNEVQIMEVTSMKVLPHSDSQIIKETELYIYNVTETMVAGSKYIIFIPFKGELKQAPDGFYKSKYYDSNEDKYKWIASTHFEPTLARRAFPCFDEPAMKATFNITIGHHEELIAISNMPIEFTEINEDKLDYVWDHFTETVPMSTYLVAYAVHEFDYKESMTSNGVKFRVWARSDAVEQAEYAKVIGPKILTIFEQYFDEKFPLPKVDMIAVPRLAASAMENWGLITYVETALLFEPGVSTALSQHNVAEVVAHELAHQWFGNLVTMNWWNEIWLNEGFATYVASLGVSQLNPKWNTLEDDAVSNALYILDLDSKESHPISVATFDGITYQKGSIIVRMMHMFLGEETFRYGIRKYLKKHRYGNVVQNDLWESLTEEGHKRMTLPRTVTVKQIMDSWTSQSGYPVITVTRDYEKGTADVNQERYSSFSMRHEEDTKGCWMIPLTYTTEKDLDFNSTIPKALSSCRDLPTKVIISNLPNDKSWVLFNVRLSGLYRVKYDKTNWDLLIDTLNGPNYKNIHKMNRAQLIDDAIEFAMSGDPQDVGTALSLIQYLEHEEEYIPWKAAVDKLYQIKPFIPSDYNFDLFIKHVLSKIYKKTQGLEELNGQPFEAIKLQSLIARYACRYDVGDCIERSVQLFSEWMSVESPDEVNTVPLNLRSVIYCTAIKNGGQDEKEFLQERLINSNVASEKRIISEALWCGKRA